MNFGLWCGFVIYIIIYDACDGYCDIYDACCDIYDACDGYCDICVMYMLYGNFGREKQKKIKKKLVNLSCAVGQAHGKSTKKG
jgi:hypothetical protein